MTEPMKRRGIIRLLAAVAGTLVGQQRESGELQLGRSGVKLSGAQSIMLSLYDKSRPEMTGIDRLIVRYKGEEVTVTADQIIEALRAE